MDQNPKEIVQTFLAPQGIKKFFTIAIICVLLGFSNYLVYAMGGTKLAYVHGFYIPIIVAGISFSITGGLITAFLSSLLSGPIMPFDVALEIAQPFPSWILRSLFFFLVGGLSGAASKVIKAYLKDLENRLITDSTTQLLNTLGLMQVWEKNSYSLLSKKPSLIVLRVHELSSIEAILPPRKVGSLFKEMADILKKIAQDFGVIAALEAGTFAFLLNDSEETEKIVENCKNKLGNVFIINEIPIFVNIFYGIATFDKDEESFISFLHRGRIAVDKAIHNNSEIALFEPEDEVQLLRNAKIIHDLSKAISSDELTLFYQPQITFESGKTKRLEALIRWPHPELGMISPAEFIPLAEGTLLINPFTKWLLEKALFQLSLLLGKGLDVCISLNFSMKNFYEAALFDLIDQTLKKYNIPPEKLEIEVTETAFSASLTQVATILNTLRKIGVRIAIDDFGTGQASLQYLLELPIDIIKIDQVFTRNMANNPNAKTIIRNAILLGHELNLEVVAEGVQTEFDYKQLKDMKCDHGQGYYFSQPLSFEAILTWLQNK